MGTSVQEVELSLNRPTTSGFPSTMLGRLRKNVMTDPLKKRKMTFHVKKQRWKSDTISSVRLAVSAVSLAIFLGFSIVLTALFLVFGSFLESTVW